MVNFNIVGFGGAAGNTLRSWKHFSLLNKALVEHELMMPRCSDYGFPCFSTSDKEWQTKLLGSLAKSVCLIAGLGGANGTGTNGIQEIAKLAKEHGKTVYAVVITPFGFEGSKRVAISEKAIVELQAVCDEVYLFPNNELSGERRTLAEVFDERNQQILEKVLELDI